jgi:hypothetical protein
MLWQCILRRCVGYELIQGGLLVLVLVLILLS